MSKPETQDPDLYKAPDPDLKGWWLVSSLEGREWIGKIAASHHAPGGVIFDPPLLPDELVLCPCFEVAPRRVSGVIGVPTQGVGPDLKPVTQIQPNIIPMHVFTIATIGGYTENGLPPQRVRRSTMQHLADWGSAARGDQRRIIAASLDASNPNRDKREIPSGPREKVH